MGRNLFWIACFLSLLTSSLAGARGVFAGTVDSATLSPAELILRPSLPGEIVFSALNDKPVALKSYKITMEISGAYLGLTITNVSPAPVTANVDTRKNVIVLEWAAIPSGVEMRATFTVQPPSIGTSTITPGESLFIDVDRTRYTGTCNTATIIVRPDAIPPAAPRNVRSIPGEGMIGLQWSAPADDDLARYNVYRRTSPSGGYGVIGTVAKTGNPESGYFDAAVQDGVTYDYVVTAVDTSGNESMYSIATRERYSAPTVLRTYPNIAATTATTGDFNGDGRRDLAFGQGSGDSVLVFLGGNTTDTPTYTISERGDRLASADLNRDGYDELIVGFPNYSTDTISLAGRVNVYAGGPVPATTPVWTMSGTNSPCGPGCVYSQAERLGFSVAPAGDLNGDGYPDAVAGAPYGGFHRAGRIVIMWGGPSVSSLATTPISGPAVWGYMGYSVASAGDVNGDGYADLLAGAPADNVDNQYGRAYLWTGGTGLRQSAVYATGTASDGFGTIVASAGDLNADGYADVAVATKTNEVSVYHGGVSMDSTRDRLIVSPVSSGLGGLAVLPLGRLNADTVDDLLTGAGVNVFFGGAAGDHIADAVRFSPEVLGVVDFDGDRLQDLIVRGGSVRIYSLLPYLSLPEMTVLTPANLAAIGTQTLTVRGLVGGPVTGLTLLGQSVPVAADGSFEATVTLHDGQNVMELIADTPDGRISKRTLTATRVQVPPLTVAITSPADGATVNATPIAVSGTVSDSTADVFVNGVRATVSGTTFSVSGIALQEGANTIAATASDQYSQTATASITVTLLTKGTITGTVTDSATTMPLAGATVSIQHPGGTTTTSTDANGLYSASVTQGGFTTTFSKAGYIPDSVSGTLVAGQILTIDRALALMPPLTLSITSPSDGATVNASPVTVTGTVSNNAQVTVNGVTAAVTSGTFSAAVPLNEGANTVTATASDQYGQTTTAGITVTLITKGAITGTVTDVETGLPIQSADVSVTDAVSLTHTTLTDANGRYTLSGVTQGNFTGTITKGGYTTHPLSGTVTAGQTLTLNAALNRVYPVISQIAVTNVTINSATVTWMTDQPTDSRVDYGTTTAYGTVVSDPTLTTTHSLSLTGLASNTTYHVKVTSTNTYGTSSSSGDYTFVTPSAITLTMTAPLDGESLGRTDVLVRGTVTNSAGRETGVVVNGVLATVFGTEFVANHVPLAAGPNTITATATDVAGDRATASLSVTASVPAQSVRITATELGLAPLETTLTMDSTLDLAGAVLSYTGPGTVEFLSVTPGSARVRMTVEGAYRFTVTVRDAANTPYQDTIAVTAVSRTSIDTLLLGKWAAMRSALSAGNIDGALTYFAGPAQARYRQQFTALAAALPQIAADMATISSVVTVDEHHAEYELQRTESAGVFSYLLIFSPDEQGLWKIQGF